MKENLIPKLSPDIELLPFDDNCFFIHQLTYDYRIKISMELKQLVELIDNKSTIIEIIAAYHEKYKINLPRAYVYELFYEKLGRYGIIENSEMNVIKSGKPNYLKLSFIVLSAKRISYITRYLKFLFEKKVFLCMLFFGIIIIGFSLITHYHTIFSAPLNLRSTLFFFVFSFIGVTFHEFGHAAAAEHYGAKHGGIGGGFYLFMPVYFADVSDIWKLSKAKRIIVNLAGVYFEIIYIYLTILAGIIFNCFPLIAFGCVFFVYTLFNLNPFLRSDGYWVLADLLGKPRLLHDSFDLVKKIWKRQAIKRKDLFLLCYGLISCFLIAYFLYFVLLKNPDSLLKFPQNLIALIKQIISKDQNFKLENLSKIMLPILFFYLSFGFLKGLILKYIKKKDAFKKKN